MRNSLRKSRGNTIAEYPGFFYFLFFLVALPMIALCTMGMRAVFFLFACRDATQQAAKCASFKNDNTTIIPNTVSAVNTGAAVFKRDVAAWNGISGSLSLAIIAKPLGTATPPAPSLGSLATVDQTNYAYFIRGTGTGTIEPLIPVGKFIGMNVPGLSGPFPLTVVSESYVENVTGLTN